MDWTDSAIVLSARKHGERSLIVQLLTEYHGRHAGLARGGNSTAGRGLFQTGNLVAAAWRGRLPEHLGTLRCEAVRHNAAHVIDDGDRLAALTSAAAIAELALPEREPHADIYRSFLSLIVLLIEPVWMPAYVRWELSLLKALGYGLDLSRCAATGRRDELIFVSPRSGRAVSREAGAPYRDKLLRLPAFLLDSSDADAVDLRSGLALTGYFLEQHVFAAQNRRLPAARQRLAWRFPTDHLSPRNPAR